MAEDYEYTFKLSFKAEWYDPTAQMKRYFIMSFFPCDNSVELYDTQFKKMFLRRSQCGGVVLKDFHVGNTISVYERLVKILDYADNMTEKYIGRWSEHTVVFIKPSGMPYLGLLFNEIYRLNFTIERLRMVHLTRVEVIDLYQHQKDNPQMPFIVEHVSSGASVVVELVGEDVIKKWVDFIGPSDPQEARRTHPNSFRALYGMDIAGNCVSGAIDVEDAMAKACYFFPQGIDKKPPAATARFTNSTCCIIKPHAIIEGKLGNIINTIAREFKITAMQMFHMPRANLEEFLEVYKGVVANFYAFLSSFEGGSCIALEISAQDGNEDHDIHMEFRKLCGPVDTGIARQIRPNTLRGMFGTDKYRNAVHCTDLPEDTKLELEYFFTIMDS